MCCLREALAASGKIAVARVVTKRGASGRGEAQEKGLMHGADHFASELLDVDEFKLPTVKEVGKKSFHMAQALIDSMWAMKPEEYVGPYREGWKSDRERSTRVGRLAPKHTRKVRDNGPSIWYRSAEGLREYRWRQPKRVRARPAGHPNERRPEGARSTHRNMPASAVTRSRRKSPTAMDCASYRAKA